MEKLLGRIAFFSLAVPIVRCATRAMCAALHATAGPTVCLRDRDTREELLFWRERASSLADVEYPFLDARNRTRYVVSTDASETHGGIVVRLPGGDRTTFTIPLPRSWRGRSSGARELFVTAAALTYVGGRLTQPAVIDVYTDSQVSVGALSGGARAPDMIRLCRRVLYLQEKFDFVVRPAWLPRELLEYEDALSRSTPLAECRIRRDVEAALREWAWPDRDGPVIDLFASPANRVCDLWVSPVPTPGAFDADGLRCDIPAAAWAFPPFAAAPRAAQRCAASAHRCLWIGPLHEGTHMGRPHILLQGPVLLAPPDLLVAVHSPLPLVAVLFE
jgi:hypothetical protein